VSQVVSETILNLRRHLITTKIKELIASPVINGEYEDRSVLENVRDYNTLHSILSEKLRRVI
jgi:DNA primase